MQSKTSRAAGGVYYYRGRYWSAMAWSKLRGQSPDGEEVQSLPELHNISGHTGQSPQSVLEEAAEAAFGR